MRFSLIWYCLVLCVTVCEAGVRVEIDAGQNVIIEAETYRHRDTKSGHWWVRVRAKRGAPGYLVASPSNNTVFDVGSKTFEKKTPTAKIETAPKQTFHE